VAGGESSEGEGYGEWNEEDEGHQHGDTLTSHKRNGNVPCLKDLPT